MLLYGIYMEENQSSKLLDSIPPVDIVIIMDCNLNYPNLPCKYREDWGLYDPSGKTETEFIEFIENIRINIFSLKRQNYKWLLIIIL